MSAPSPSTSALLELPAIALLLLALATFCAIILLGLRTVTTMRLQTDDLVFRAPNILQSPAPHRAIQIKMTKVPIPFTFKLLDSSKTTYAEVQCSVSSQVRYTLRACWGVSIRDLHTTLWRPWEQLCNALAHDMPPCQYRAPDLKYGDHMEQTLKLRLPPSHQLKLGNPPRLYYPLVVLLTRDDDLDRPQSDETVCIKYMRVALVNVVHIKDSICPLPTSVLAQYLKQANGQLSCLKQLYLASGDPATYELSGTTSEQLCAVCQAFPLSRALLPCRHTCVCAQCFSKLDRCPMCRSPILSYFCIRGEEYVPMEVGNPSKSTSTFFDAWNDRLIDFLGFR